ncbi:MAG: M23 family metallopeptidase [Anaerosomatales bacterium]|nr:M23 family metallopeptidase [Anaerosomatales bacterium]
MGRFRVLMALCALAALSLPGTAYAAEEVLLGFGSAYDLDGRTVVHRGMDVAAAAGAPVRALVDGTVRFAGPVPADGGGSVIAVTVELAEGDLVTVHPLSDARVEAGDVVARGDALGTLAEAGDRSSASAHVHVSCRRDGTYVDPRFLLATPAPSEPAERPAPLPTAAAPVAVTPSVTVVGSHSEVPAGTGEVDGMAPVLATPAQAPVGSVSTWRGAPRPTQALEPLEAGVPSAVGTGVVVRGPVRGPSSVDVRTGWALAPITSSGSRLALLAGAAASGLLASAVTRHAQAVSAQR